MRSFPPNISPTTLNFSAFLLAEALAEDSTLAEATSIGTWFILVGENMISAATHRAVLEERELCKSHPDQYPQINPHNKR